MASYQEIPSPTSSEVYRNVRGIVNTLETELASSILERITSDMDMEDSFAFSTFYKEAAIRSGSAEDHVFLSEYYRDKIFAKVERMLYNDGYICKISVDNSGRYRKIRYSARVLNPMTRILRAAMPLITSAMAFGGYYLYNYVKMHQSDEGMKA